MPHLQPNHLSQFRQSAQRSTQGLSACCWSVLHLIPGIVTVWYLLSLAGSWISYTDGRICSGQHFRQLHASTALQGDSPAVLAQWVQQQGGKVDGIAVQPAGDCTGYGIWSAQVPPAHLGMLCVFDIAVRDSCHCMRYITQRL